MKVPILLVAFNRPEATQKVINSLELIQPKKIYAAIDAPRTHKGKDELLKNNKVIDIINSIDWDCELEIIRPEKNLGCKLNISQAITYIFEKEENLIVIEDDIIAAPSFFAFAEEMLERYKDATNIGIVTANNYTPVSSSTDYYFSKYTHIWGWALWKRTWDGFDVNLDFLNGKNPIEILNNMHISSSERNYMRNYYLNVKVKIDKQEMNAWGPQFFLYNFLKGYLTITPKTNLAMNIGVESSRVDSNTQYDVHFRPIDYNFKVLTHPNHIKVNEYYDKIHFKKHINYRPSLLKRIIGRLKRIF